MPYGIRATWVPDVPRFYGPAAKDPRAARNPGDPGFRFADSRSSADPTHSVGIRATVGASICIYMYIYIY